MTTYRERLRLPISWWLFGAFFTVTIGWIFLVVTTWTTAIIAALIVAVPLAGALWTYGSLILEVRDGDILIGRARLEGHFQGPARALAAGDFRHAMGPGADARAFLSVRPYVKTGALIPVTDSGDPTPYWLVSTRHPDAFVASITHSGEDRHAGDVKKSAEPIGENTGVEED